MSGRLPAEEGSGSVLVLAVTGVVVSVLVAALLLGGVVLARHRAEAAADLAALAGAGALQAGRPPCPRAAAVATANGASATCAVEGEEVLVTARVILPRACARVAGRDDAVARARAGPPRR